MRAVVAFNYNSFVPLHFLNCANHWNMNGMFVSQFIRIAFIELKGRQKSLKALLYDGVHGGSQLLGIIPVTGQ